MFEPVEHNTVSISILLHAQENHVIILILKYSTIFIVLGVRLTNYQQIHPDTSPAAQQMFTSLLTYLFGQL